MKIKLIINPEAGIQKRNLDRIKKNIFLNKEERTERKIEEFFKKKELEIDIAHTKKAGDATNIAKRSKNYDIIIAAGGDGTINEVINGIENYKTKLGIIPIGSENVVSKELKIPTQINEACNIILKGKTKKIDLGLINNKKFIFVVGIGFDAHAITNVKREVKRLIGKHSYTIAGLKTLFEHKPEELKIKIDNKKEETGYFAIISNVKRYGGNIKITPEAELDDGYLDLCIFKNRDVWSVMKYVIGVASGQISKLKEIKHYKIKKADIKAKNKVLYHTAAEIGGTTPVKVSVLPRKLEIIVP
ncbi:MAG: diacylglycerol kinase family lipid kinase [DPANN group archaeon]|nr:diacylglycerol kinase family lipid kinase [DPANN group archaeon]